MTEIKYKVLKEYGDLKEGEVIEASLFDANAEELDQLIADGVIEMVSEDGDGSAVTTDETDELKKDAENAPSPETPTVPEAPAQAEAPSEPQAPSDETPAKYKVLAPIDIKDGSGGVQGQYRVGQIVEFPTSVGDGYVEQGLAEKVEE